MTRLSWSVLDYPMCIRRGAFCPTPICFQAVLPMWNSYSVPIVRWRCTSRRRGKNGSEKLPLDTPYEALILASIVEKETGVAEERPRIAGVFTRSLQKGMRLETDPTVIYGLGQSFDGNLRRKHLRQDTPYNTYVRRGLPPTPIAMPGSDAIHAALHPEPGPDLYFRCQRRWQPLLFAHLRRAQKGGSTIPAEAQANQRRMSDPSASSVAGRFVTLEGIEGAGKRVTQLEWIEAMLREAGKRVLTTREPGGTPVAEKIRAVLLDKGNATMSRRRGAAVGVCSARRAPGTRHPPRVARRHLGRVRPVYRCDLRLSGRRADG